MIRILQTVIETSVFFLMNSHIFIYSCSLSQLNIRWSTLYISKLHPCIVLICIILMWSFQVCLSAIALYLLVIFYNSGAFFCFKTIGRNYNWFHWATSKYYFETYSGLWAVYVVGDIKHDVIFHMKMCVTLMYILLTNLDCSLIKDSGTMSCWEKQSMIGESLSNEEGHSSLTNSHQSNNSARPSSLLVVMVAWT